jgi:hypothetical protein
LSFGCRNWVIGNALRVPPAYPSSGISIGVSVPPRILRLCYTNLPRRESEERRWRATLENRKRQADKRNLQSWNGPSENTFRTPSRVPIKFSDDHLASGRKRIACFSFINPGMQIRSVRDDISHRCQSRPAGLTVIQPIGNGRNRASSHVAWVWETRRRGGS